MSPQNKSILKSKLTPTFVSASGSFQKYTLKILLVLILLLFVPKGLYEIENHLLKTAILG